MRSILVCFLILLFCTSSHAQNRTDNQTCAWYMYFGNHRISERIGLHTEYQWRRYTMIDYWQQSLMRVGIDYYTKAGPIITAGYGWIQSFPYGDQPIAYPFNEHRIWQQLVLTQAAARFSFHHRFRLEQRFLERKTINSSGDYESDEFVFRQRGRYRFFVAFPLNRKQMEDNTLFLAAYDEVMIGFGGGIKQNVLEQNRLYLAMGWRFNANANVQMGYLNQFIFKSNGDRENNDVFQLALTYNLDFRKN
ncbi:MAG: DUF2490 domain-containing protein [Vicingaceae bacterium]